MSGVLISLRVKLLIALREQALAMCATYSRSRIVFWRSTALCVCIERSNGSTIFNEASEKILRLSGRDYTDY